MSTTISSSPPPNAVCEKMVGSANDRHDTRSMVTLTSALFTMKVCSFSATKRMPRSSSTSSACCMDSEKLTSSGAARGPAPPISTRPPKKKDMPRTRSRLESTEPSSVALTTCSSPARRVCTVMIISTAFPKVALRRPLITSLCRQASSSSVASPRIFASGIMAAKFNQKVHSGLQPCSHEIAPSGKQSRKRLKGCCRMDFRPPAFRSHAVNGGGAVHSAATLELTETSRESPSALLRFRFACQIR
mmetsp:Transcript_63095/g.162463  ORF Transcript_63095/g.162463 Transcript_63095/m.162463 type:complete len:246 (+) Transcript_63095:665-1402(+)